MTATRHKRHLIVNADDFGQSVGVNRGVIEAHERGIVTSASLMVRWPAATEAAAYARQRPALSLGLHFDFGEWRYHQQTWIPLYKVVDEQDIGAVAAEARRQVAEFRRLIGQNPTHFDSHQHIHLRSRLSSVFAELAAELGVPLRGCSRRVHYYGGFYGQDDQGQPFPDCIGIPALVKALEHLSPGFTELGCHPGYADDLDSMYRRERIQELETLCHPEVRATMRDRNIALCAFHDVLLESGNGESR